MSTENAMFFVCPACHSGLEFRESSALCTACGRRYGRAGKAFDFRTLLKDGEGWDAEAFDRAYAKADGGFQDGFKYAESAGIPRYAEEYRQAVKEKLMEELLVGARPRKVLDVGCGYGWFCFELAGRLPETAFFGVDISPSRINLFKMQIDKANAAGRIDAVVSNGEKLPFPDGSFDAVILREVVEHLQNPHDTFREVRRVLAPNGFVVFSTPTKAMTAFWKILAVLPSIAKRIVKGEQLVKKPAEVVRDSPLSMKELNKIIEENGFLLEKWRRGILLPHESYLQYIPGFILKPMVRTVYAAEKIGFLSVFGLHHVVALRKVA